MKLDPFAIPYATPDGIQVAIRILGMFSTLWAEIDKLIPDSREKSLALTKLQEADLWLTEAALKSPSPPTATKSS